MAIFAPDERLPSSATLGWVGLVRGMMRKAHHFKAAATRALPSSVPSVYDSGAACQLVPFPFQFTAHHISPTIRQGSLIEPLHQGGNPQKKCNSLPNARLEVTVSIWNRLEEGEGGKCEQGAVHCKPLPHQRPCRDPTTSATPTDHLLVKNSFAPLNHHQSSALKRSPSCSNHNLRITRQSTAIFTPTDVEKGGASRSLAAGCLPTC